MGGVDMHLCFEIINKECERLGDLSKFGNYGIDINDSLFVSFDK